MYLVAIWAPDPMLLKTSKRLTRSFIWGAETQHEHRMSRLSWKQFIGPKSEGGLGLIDFNSQVTTIQAK